MKHVTKILLLVALAASGCAVEPTTNYLAVLKNNSGSTIRLIPYLNNEPIIENVIILGNNSQTEIANGSDRGKVNHAGFDSKYLSGMDSIIAIYNDSLTVVHYRTNPVMPSAKSILNENSRNIFNYLNYDYTFSDKSNSLRIANYIFTFTEADYEFAKD